MILHSLVSYYDQLLSDGVDIPLFGYTRRKVKYFLDINAQGELVRVVPHTEIVMRGKKEVEEIKSCIVPDGGVRSSGVKAYLLCDNSKYLLGLDSKSKDSVSERHFEATKVLHQTVFAHLDDNPYAQAVLAFFENWSINRLSEHRVLQQVVTEDKAFESANLAFRYAADLKLIHEEQAIKIAWDNHFQKDLGTEGLCLVTGKQATIARLHDKVKGIAGGQASGVNLISYNAESFESYINSPVSAEVAFKYTSTLNHLLATNKNKVRMGETTVVYYTSDGNATSELLMGFPMGVPTDENEELKGIFDKIVQGLPINQEIEQSFEQDFYLIGLAPNNARVAVRFFFKNTFGSFINNIRSHVQRFEIQGPKDRQPYLTPWELSQEAINKNTKEKHDDLMVSLLKAVLMDENYPLNFITKVIARMKADIHGDETAQKYAVNYRRVGMIKAYLLKQTNYSQEEITVALNPTLKEVPYLLGRLFATYEKIQEDEGSNVNIKKNYFSAATTTPAVIFPRVVKNGELYLEKLPEHPYQNNGIWMKGSVFYKKTLGAVMSLLPAEQFPKTLSFEDQNLFILGYYQQRQDFFNPKDNQAEEKKHG